MAGSILLHSLRRSAFFEGLVAETTVGYWDHLREQGRRATWAAVLPEHNRLVHEVRGVSVNLRAGKCRGALAAMSHREEFSIRHSDNCSAMLTRGVSGRVDQEI